MTSVQRGLTGVAVNTGSLRDRAAQVVTAIMRAHAVHCSRRLLADLDQRALADLGITRAQAHFEAERPFWDLTPPRRR